MAPFRLLTESFEVTGAAGRPLYGQIVRPQIVRPQIVRPRGTRSPGLPAVVLLPGGLGAGRTMPQREDARALAARGMVVAGFNARGRTSGKVRDPRSPGRVDLNGYADQDDLARVIRDVLDHPAVDARRFGLFSNSYGLVAAAGCVARHPHLPVRWLVDEEGPSDACVTLLCPWRLGQSPPQGSDSPASTPTGPDPGMARALFGHGCPEHGGTAADARWWSQREAIRYLPAFRGRYLRLQAERDHVQPPQDPVHAHRFHQPPQWWRARHACDLVNAAVQGGVPWVRVNLPAQGNAVNATYGPERGPVLLPGALSDHPGAWVEAVWEMVQATS